MFRLPTSTYKLVYYADIIIDLFKMQTKEMPPLVRRREFKLQHM